MFQIPKPRLTGLMTTLFVGLACWTAQAVGANEIDDKTATAIGKDVIAAAHYTGKNVTLLAYQEARKDGLVVMSIKMRYRGALTGIKYTAYVTVRVDVNKGNPRVVDVAYKDDNTKIAANNKKLKLVGAELAKRLQGQLAGKPKTLDTNKGTNPEVEDPTKQPAVTLGQEVKPNDTDSQITRAVLELAQKKHVLNREFDRRMAGQSLDAYLSALDPQKLYFLQSDIAEFSRRKPELAEDLKAGDITIAFEVYRRYQQRVAEAEVVRQVLLKPGARYDFTEKEVVLIDPKARDYAKDAKVFREQWRLWVKYTLLAMKTDSEVKDFDQTKACEELSASYARFARGVQNVKRHEILEWFLSFVGGRYDSGMTYMSPVSVKEYKDAQRGHFVGIGVQINDHNRIEEVILGGPAHSNGELKPNDRITSVGPDSRGGMTDVTRLTQKEFFALLRGEEGTEVRLGVLRPGENRPRIVKIRRGKVVADNSKVEARILTSGATKVGYLDVPNFYRDEKSGDSTAIEVRRQLKEFTEKSVDVVVLDLRRCGGGYLDQAIDLAGLFIGKGPILQSKNQAGDVTTLENEKVEMAWNKPLVVLTGRRTASGAEAVCAAIQDHQRGLVVGDDATYGLGLIRTPMDVATDKGLLMVTTNQFYRVNGRGVQQIGVNPDIMVPSPSATRPRASLDTGSNFGSDGVKAASFQSQRMVSRETALVLRAASSKRRRASAEFKALQRLTEWEYGKSALAVETLNEQEYREKLKRTPTAKLSRAKPGEGDFHLQEVCAIAADYVRVIEGRKAEPANIVKAPPPEDPRVIRRREQANQREALRQSIEYREEEIRVLNNKVVVARLAEVAARRFYNDAPAGSAKEFVAELAHIAAVRTLAELDSSLRRAKSELEAERRRYNNLRE